MIVTLVEYKQLEETKIDTIKKEVEGWREELELKILSDATQQIMDTALNEGSSGTTAAKWLADRGWEKKRGRPSKEELARQERMRGKVHEELDDYAERVGLSVVPKKQ